MLQFPYEVIVSFHMSPDYTDLEGAVGYSPPTEGAAIPEWEEDGAEDERSIVRRRRLERFASENSRVKDNIDLDWTFTLYVDVFFIALF